MFDTNIYVRLINEHAKQLIYAGKRITVTGEEETNILHGAIQGQIGAVMLTYGRSKPASFPCKGSYGAEIDFKDASLLVVALKAGSKSFRCTDIDGEPLVVTVA